MSSASYAANTTKNTSYNKQDIKLLVDLIAERHKVPNDLAHAIVSLESNYDPNATGELGEIGLGQIRCGTAKSEGFKGKCTELYKPEVNLEYSMAYLRYALDRTKTISAKQHRFIAVVRSLDLIRPHTAEKCLPIYNEKIISNSINMSVACQGVSF